MDTIDQIQRELERLGLDATTGDGSLDAMPTDDPAFVALMDTQETTVFEAAGVLQALQACPQDATWDDVWQAILPYQAEA